MVDIFFFIAEGPKDFYNFLSNKKSFGFRVAGFRLNTIAVEVISYSKMLLWALFSRKFNNGSTSMRRQAETQRLQLIQQATNVRYESSPFGVKQQSQRACQV